MDNDHFLGRAVITSMAFEPALDVYVRRVVEEELGVPLDELHVEFIGYRYAYYFPSRHDDFVLRIELTSSAAGVSGEFEGVIKGIRFLHAYELFGQGREGDIPHTGLEVPEEEWTMDHSLESWADRRAYLHRLATQLVTRRLADEVRAARL